MSILRLLSPLLALMLLSCGEAEAPPPNETEAQSGDIDAKPGLSATDGVLMLPIVAGNPGAAYFTLQNTGGSTAELAGIHIEGAEKSEMHRTEGGSMQSVETLDVPVGATVEFARGGLHVMAFGLSDNVETGGATEMTLIFSDGDKLSIPLGVKSMSGLEIGDAP